jgi:hypothetical protein
MDLQEAEWGGMDWFAVAQDRDRWRALVNAVMNLQVKIKFGEFFDWLRTFQFLRKDSVPWSQ